MKLNFSDVFFLSPEIVLTVWGLVVLLVDLGLAHRQDPAQRRRRIGWLSLMGVGLALLAAVVVCLVPLYVRADPLAERSWLSPKTAAYFMESDPLIFFGTIAGDLQSSVFNVVYVILLGLVVGLSMSTSFTEELGEYFAPLVLGDGGDDAAHCRRRARHAVLDSRDDDHLPLPEHGPGENEAAIGGGGAEILRLRVGVIGAISVWIELYLWHDGHDPTGRDSQDSP